MRNKRKMQESAEQIVNIKDQIKTYESKLKSAFFDYYIASGMTVKQAERMIR